MPDGVLTLRARQYIAWAVSLTLDLWPPLKERHVQALIEPTFDTQVRDVLEWWPPELHALIVSRVVRESREAFWTAVGSDEPPPPPIIRR